MNAHKLGSSSEVALFKVSCPVNNLGYGRRLVFWTAGCDIGCAGCCSRDSWDSSGQRFQPSEMVGLAQALIKRHGQVDGITLSGGEPTLWALGLSEFLKAARQEFRGIDVLLYSGLPWRKLQQEHSGLLSHCDAVVPEPFVNKLPSSHPLLGSANQALNCLTLLGCERYGASRDRLAPLQATVQSGVINLTGVPKGPALVALTNALERRGMRIQSVSWE